MIANGLPQSLSKPNYPIFIQFIGLDDITEVLQQQKRLKEFRKQIKAKRAQKETLRQKVMNVVIMASGRAKAYRI